MSRAVSLPPARRLVALKALPGFAHLPPAQLIEMGSHARPRLYEPGETIQPAGLVPEHLHLVVSGSVACTREGAPLVRVRPFGLVGGIELLSGDSVGFAAQAEDRVITLSLEVSVIRAILADNFAIFMAVIADVARHIIGLRRSIPPRADGPSGAARPLDERSDNIVGVVAALLDVRELAELPIDVLAVLASQARRHHLSAGTHLWRRGDPCRDAVLLVRGRIDCPTDGSEGISFVERGRRLWGLEEALVGGVQAFDAVAASDAEVLLIDQRVLLDELEDDVTAALAFLNALVRIASALDAYLQLPH